MSSATGVGAESSSGQVTLVGRSASPGIAYGQVTLGSAGIEEMPDRPLGEREVEGELDRLESAGRAARVSLLRQREALANRFTPEEQRIFDTHVKLLSDPVLEADVRERISNQQMNLEAAVKDVLSVYERLFEVVESENLRNRMIDLRDVAVRLLRHCRRPGGRRKRREIEGGVLVVKELTLSDLTEAIETGIAAIVAEGGSAASHGAILTRAAAIPAVIGVGAVRESLAGEDRMLVDGDSGQVVINPTPEMVSAARGAAAAAGEVQPLGPLATADGQQVVLQAAVASPGEARTAAALGVTTAGLLRTELPVIQRRGRPREASLVALYRQVVKACDRVNFRLPDLDSVTELTELFPLSEPNPALGLRGTRLLRAQPELLSRQLRAILQASEGGDVFVAAPFVTDLSDLRFIREALDNAREELRMEGQTVAHRGKVGVVIETPAAALLARELMSAADFVLVGLDNLSQNMLAADRRSLAAGVSALLSQPHPVVLRAVRKLAQVADGLDKEITVYGESAAQATLLPLLLGVGIRNFAIRPDQLALVHQWVAEIDAGEAERVADAACRAATGEELAAQLPPEWS